MNEEEDRFARVRLVDGAKGDDALAAIPFSVRVERRSDDVYDDDDKKRRERKKRREFSGHRKKKTGVTTPKSEGKLKKGQKNPKYTYILLSTCTLIKPKLKNKWKPKRVPRGTVGTSDEGFGGLVGYDACLTRRRSSVRLRPEIQLFFLHVCTSSKREREYNASDV